MKNRAPCYMWQGEQHCEIHSQLHKKSGWETNSDDHIRSYKQAQTHVQGKQTNWCKGYEGDENKQRIPEVSVKCESWDADVREYKVLHQEVQQLKQLKQRLTSVISIDIWQTNHSNSLCAISQASMSIKTNISINFYFTACVPCTCQCWGLYHVLVQCTSPKADMCRVVLHRLSEPQTAMHQYC